MRTDRLPVKLVALLLALLTLLSCASCGVTAPDATAEEPTAEITTAEIETAAETTAATPEKYTVRLNAPASTAIHTDLQARYLADKDPLSIKNYLKPAYAAQSVSYDDNPGTIELSRPVPITLTWNVETDLAASDIRSFIVRIWRGSQSGKATVTATLSKSTQSYEFVNPTIGETYVWTVTAYDADGASYTSETASFQTDAQGPRNLTVDGVTNVRDLGGWQTEDGGRIRQGLLFRGAKLVNNDNKSDVLITSDGIKTMRDGLGIKSEIDLRLKKKLGGLTSSALGSAVTFYSIPLDDDWGVMFTSAENLQGIRDVFAVLADKSNYPVYFHCSIGTDRTGMIAWLVNGLCGVAETDLWRDYLFSNYGKVNNKRTSGIKSVYVDKLNNAQGDTLADKIYNYLKDTIQVPEAHLKAVIRIMKEPATTNP